MPQELQAARAGIATQMLRKDRAGRTILQFVGTGWFVATVVEVAALGGCYYYYRHLDRSQESRYWLFQHFRPGLEAFYKLRDMTGNDALQTYDYKTWGIQE
ncbi:hypothetical protein HPB49_023225 [Dermacentor silvarum]|uniref:Uncharacterized protein n=1 Tax=Dermacentor silvarum TaxID=543639 RepID=A0ACB8CI41_DERSI|nr:hypothetical protein HPB49_023225 [Dermacentor silvarum]